MSHPFVRPRSKQRGFTLIELMVVLVVLAILLTIGVPGFQNIIRDNRAATLSNEFLGALQLARSTAVSGDSGNRVIVCPICNDDGDDCNACGGSWQDGWMVLVEGPDEVIRSRGSIPEGVTINAPEFVRFSNMGEETGNVGEVNIDINVDFGARSTSRSLTILPSGFSRIENQD